MQRLPTLTITPGMTSTGTNGGTLTKFGVSKPPPQASPGFFVLVAHAGRCSSGSSPSGTGNAGNPATSICAFPPGRSIRTTLRGKVGFWPWTAVQQLSATVLARKMTRTAWTESGTCSPNPPPQLSGSPAVPSPCHNVRKPTPPVPSGADEPLPHAWSAAASTPKSTAKRVRDPNIPLRCTLLLAPEDGHVVRIGSSSQDSSGKRTMRV